VVVDAPLPARAELLDDPRHEDPAGTAPEGLGGLDQRRFEFAAVMLRQLGVEAVRVFTSNPLKIAALREAGLAVIAEQGVLGRATAENVRYLASKRDRAGHDINLDMLAAYAPPSD